jgi:hypothetical protein
MIAFIRDRQLDRRRAAVAVAGRPRLASPAQGSQCKPAEPEREEDRDGEHQAGQGQHRERSDHQDEQGNREREDLDREGREADNEHAGLSGEVGQRGGFGMFVHTPETEHARRV